MKTTTPRKQKMPARKQELHEALARIARSARDRPQQWLREARVPEGGE